MNINKNNYEAFFLDYHEGNLSPQEVAELLLFIEQHPELKEEFESFENITLDDLSSVNFENKSGLKKSITEENREEYFIRAAEGNLNLAEEKLLADFIQLHPQYLAELELFRKTILTADASIVFENKHELKKAAILSDTDQLLIASMEGLLSREEQGMLKQQLNVDAALQHELSLYKKTVLSADESIIYENKEGLKRKERKVVPIFWYVSGVAAAILFLLGLFFLLSPGAPELKKQEFAKNNTQKTVNSTQKEIDNTQQAVNSTQKEIDNKQTSSDNLAEAHENGANKIIRNEELNKQNPSIALVNNAPQPEMNIAENKNEEPKQQPQLNSNNEQPVFANNQQPAVSNEQPAIASSQGFSSKSNSGEYLTLRELAAEKIKEKTLDDKSVAQQKQNGRLKRFSGWDLAQIVTRGISKVTGRDLEVKPQYNEEGDVTAYALGNAFEVSRGK
jgi:ElaB/YqjD/DUF883 family membrane-anchored ribosome-binding protein